MDAANSGAASGNSILRIQNALASVAVVLLACGVYAIAPYNQQTLTKLYGPPAIAFTGRDFLLTAGGIYSLLLVLYFLIDGDPRISKSLRFFRLLAQAIKTPADLYRRGLTRDDRLALLTTLLKAFFAPLMVTSLMLFCVDAWSNGTALLEVGITDGSFRWLFDRFGFWFLMQTILFVDVLIFTVGYLVESRRLGNEIRSVDPTLLGWAAALLCYTPFNALTSKVLGAQVSDFPQFDDPSLHIALNLLLLMLMALYASASVALGLKASNLTHRGIVSRGPYAVVRHPAYACKNMAWWIGATPAVMAEFEQSLVSGLLGLASVAAWSLLYVLRAVTEEDHLRSVDAEYAAYAARVRHRFIPGLI